MLRPYQEEAINRVLEDLKKKQSVLLVMATGCGKTYTVANIIEQFCPPEKGRILFLVDFRQIAFQTKKVLAQYYPHWKPGIHNGGFGVDHRPGLGLVMEKYDDIFSQIVVSTPQTLIGSVDKPDFKRFDAMLEHGLFDFVIIDEAHKCASDTYLLLIKKLKDSNPNVKIVGMTATPHRQDGRALGLIFNKISYEYTLERAVREGYCCPIEVMNIEAVKLTSSNPINDDDQVPDEGTNFKVQVADNFKELMLEFHDKYAKDRHGIWFMPSIEVSREMTLYLQSKGIKAAHVDAIGSIGFNGVEGKGQKKRQDIIDEACRGEEPYHLLCVSALSTGVDIPPIDLVVLATGYTSPTILTQMIGRGTRVQNHRPDKKLLVANATLNGISIVERANLGGIFNVGRSEKKEKSDVEIVELIEKNEPLINKPVLVGGLKVRSIGSIFNKSSDGRWFPVLPISATLESFDAKPWGWLSSPVLRNKIFMVLLPDQEQADLYEAKLEANPDNKLIMALYSIYSQNSLWVIDGEEKDKYVVWKKPEKSIYKSPNLEELIDYSDQVRRDLENIHGAYKLAEKKSQTWMRQDPSEAQLKFLSRLEERLLKHGIEINQGFKATSGTCAAAITHMLACEQMTLRLKEVVKEIK